MIINALGQSYNFVNQEEQLGTGHAVMVTEDHFKSYNGDILVLYGDMPLISKDTFKNIINAHQKTHAECTLLTATVDSPPAYGRIIRDSYGRIIDIVEQRDCTADQLNINEVNVGVYVFKSNILYESLKQLSNNNSQNEYYLTDVPKILIREGASVQTYSINEIDEIYGVNTPNDLKHCERVLLKQANEKI
jgi:bifunctional UDP-N-acetylglucosamine pyrophosphorylase/glucosamine-1-phosphate N-acetyltransferase